MAREVRAAMSATDLDYELVFVDDGSKDDTWGEIERARAVDANVRGLKHLRNAGQSAALWTGLRSTTSPLIATLDGDLQNDPADLPMLLRALEDCDFVCGV